MSLAVGQKAPDFRLLGSDKQMHALTEDPARVTVLFFTSATTLQRVAAS